MSLFAENIKITADEYIELKKIGYDLYKIYRTLNQKEQQYFLQNLPKMDVEFKNVIIKNTLLFPDTEHLVKTPKEKLMKQLSESVGNSDLATSKDALLKYAEYMHFPILRKIELGELSFMDDFDYTDEQVSENKYIAIKKEELEELKPLCEKSLPEINKMVSEMVKEDSYENKIRLSTRFIPNDALFMFELQNSTFEQIAHKYNIPIEMIQFKAHEYEKQNTKKLIIEGKISSPVINSSWMPDESLYEVINILWDQSFYNLGLETQKSKIKTNLTNFFGKTSIKIQKK